MEQYTDSQYDDDLTVGIDELEESIETEYVDLFEHGGSEESPVARLKTIVLSIDWEITDENLTQFNEELLDLKDIWADDKLKLVYVQALEKISKYIFQLKADSHPDAIKLLLTFFYNLEKIVTDSNLSEAEKKEILRADVKKFEQLKYQISDHERSDEDRLQKKPAPTATITEHGESHPVLFNLKASILGMDWEINDRELNDLSKEIKHLEEKFEDNKTKQIFLQGIETLGGYIKLKRSNAHADAFKLLYSFYEGLEKTVLNDLSNEEEKAILLPEVEKFEAFKQIIGPTITPEALAAKFQEEQQDVVYADDDDFVRPAFSDVPSDVTGFQAEKEAVKIQDTAPVDVEDRLENFFSEAADTDVPAQEGVSAEAEEQLASFFDEAETAEAQASVSAEEALRGVDVETDADDESEEEALPIQDDGVVAPALVETEEDFGFSPVSESPGLMSEADDQPPSEVEDRLGSLFEAEDEIIADSTVDPAVALAGVDVETDADDDADEAPLPSGEDDLAPALAETGEQEEKSEEFTEIAAVPEALGIEDHVEGFFPDDTEDVALADAASESEAIAGSLPDEDASTEAELEVADSFFVGESEEFSEEQLFETPPEEDGEPPELQVIEDEPVETIEEKVDSFFEEEAEELLASEFEGEATVEETELAATGLEFEQTEVEDEEPEDRVELETAELVSELEEYQEEKAEEEVEPEVVELAPELEVEEEAEPEAVELAPELEAEEEAEPEAVELAPELEAEEEAEPEAVELAPELEAEEEAEPEAVELAPELEAEEEAEPEAVELAPELEAEEEAEPEAVELAPELEAEEEAEPEAVELAPELEAEEEAEPEAVELAPELEAEEEAEPEAVELASELEAEEEQDAVVFEAVSEDELEEPSAEDLPTAEIEESLLEEEDFFTTSGEHLGEPTKAEIHPLDKSDFFVDETAIIEDGPEEDSFIDKELAEVEEEEKAFFAATDYAEGEEHAFFATTDDIEEDKEETPETVEEGDEVQKEFFEEPEQVLEEAAEVEQEYEEAPIDVGVAAIPSDDNLAPLRAGIESLSAEITDTNVQGVFSALNDMRRQLVSKPMEKTCLQLVSTIVQHIGQYKDEASPEANALLLSAFNNLELVQKPETQLYQAQEALLSETFKVLQWQQKMIDSQAITKDEVDVAEQEVKKDLEPDTTVEKDVPAEDTKVKVKPVAKSEISSLADMIKTEVEELRGTFKAEIEKLRQQLKDISDLE